MSEKDSLASQDIPAVARAFGTLALAAAMVVAINWFLSRENKEEKSLEDNETELQLHPDAVSQEKKYKCNTPCLLGTATATKPTILKVNDVKDENNSKSCMDNLGIQQDKVLLERGQRYGGSLNTLSMDWGNVHDEENRGYQLKETSTSYSANTGGQNVGEPIHSKTNNTTIFVTSRDLHVTIPKIYIGSREAKIKYTCAETLTDSCTEGSPNKSLCEKSKILGEHGNNCEIQKPRIMEQKACDIDVKSHRSNATNMTDDDCYTAYMHFRHQTSTNVSEIHNPELNVLYNGVLNYDSKLDTADNDTKYKTEQHINLQSENAGNALEESREEKQNAMFLYSASLNTKLINDISIPSQREFSDSCSIETGNITELISKTGMCTSQQNIVGLLDDSDVVNDGLLTSIGTPRASLYDVWFEEKEYIINNLQKPSTTHSSLSAPDDNLLLSNQVDDHADISYNDADDTHKNKHLEYIPQNDPGHKNSEIIVPNESSLPFQPLKRCPSNCDISGDENKCVLHPTNDCTVTTAYKYRNILEREPSNVLHNCPFDWNSSKDTQATKWTKEVQGETHSLFLKMKKVFPINCSSIDDATVTKEKWSSGNSCCAEKYTSNDTEIRSLEKMHITGKLFDTTNEQCNLSILITKPKKYLLGRAHNLDISNIRDTTGTEFALCIRDINVLNAEINSTEELSSTETNCPSTHLKDISIKMNKTGTGTHQYSTYGFTSPMTLANMLCQQPDFTKMLEKENNAGIETCQNLQEGKNAQALYRSRTPKTKQNTLTLQNEKYKDKNVSPSEMTEDILKSDLNVLSVKATENIVANKKSSQTKMHFSLSGLRTISTSFKDEVTTDYADDSITTQEDFLKNALSYSILKRSQGNLSGNLLLPIRSSGHHLTSIPELKMSLVSKSCENIHSGVLSQRPKLKSKAKSVLCLLTEHYSSTLYCCKNGPIEEVSRGRFFRIPNSFQHIADVTRLQLTLGNCLELLKLARKNNVPEVLQAAYMVISDNYLNVLKNTAIYSQLTISDRERILHLRMRGRPSLCVLEANCIFGLNKTNLSIEESGSPQTKNQIYTLDLEQNQWNIVTSIPEEASLKGSSICSMHNYLFIAGGIQKRSGHSTCSNRLFCYNPLTDIWSQLTPMNQARSQLTLVPLDGYLFAIGGECLHTMEKYDPRSNRWIFRAPLPKGSFAVAHEATACGGDIYVSGGHLFYRLLKYSPTQDSWEECPFNASKGRSCDMVSIKNVLYRFDMQRDSRVSVLKYSTTTKIWTEYSAIFPASKIPFKCVVLNGIIYCLNRETTARFTDGDGEAVFESVVFNTFPTKRQGSLYPVVLNLHGPVQQTSV